MKIFRCFEKKKNDRTKGFDAHLARLSFVHCFLLLLMMLLLQLLFVLLSSRRRCVLAMDVGNVVGQYCR